MKKPRYSGLSLFLGILALVRFGSAQDNEAPAPSASSQPSASASATAEVTGPDTASAGPADTSQTGAATVAGSTAGTAPPTTIAGNSEASTQAAAIDEGSSKDKKNKNKRNKNKKKNRNDKNDAERDDKDDKTELPWEARAKIRIGGLIHSEFAINDSPGTPDYEFRLTNARLFVTWQQGTLLDAQAEIELSRDRDRNPSSWAPMRDAYARITLDPALRMRMGQFKRPFGGLQLTSLRDLKLIRRGISDVWVNEELNYGERDIGFQVAGKIGKGLELNYALGVFNGRGRNSRDLDPNGSKDFVGRLEGHFGKHLRVAVNSANKRFDQAYIDYASYPTSTWMSGADVLVEYQGLYGYVEGQYGSNYQSLGQYHTASALALVAYKIPVASVWQLAVEPLVKGEVLRVETEVRGRQILNGTAGANLYVGELFRLMVQGEWIEPKGPLPTNLAEAQAEKRLIFQAGIYTR